MIAGFQENLKMVKDKIINSDERFVYDPDLTSVAKLMNQTWPRPGWRYTRELLNAYIYRPTGDPSLSVAYYFENQLAGYQAYVPYTIYFDGKKLQLVYATWWTASSKFPEKNIGLKLYKELLSLSRLIVVNTFFSTKSSIGAG